MPSGLVKMVWSGWQCHPIGHLEKPWRWRLLADSIGLWPLWRGRWVGSRVFSILSGPQPGECVTRTAAGDAYADAGATITATLSASNAAASPTKLPEIGIVWRMWRATATGIRLNPPTLRLVGSNMIQPAPGT